jgi:hypothetical protein
MSAFISEKQRQETEDYLKERNLDLFFDNSDLARQLRKARATVHSLRLQRKHLRKVVTQLGNAAYGV